MMREIIPKDRSPDDSLLTGQSGHEAVVQNPQLTSNEAQPPPLQDINPESEVSSTEKEVVSDSQQPITQPLPLNPVRTAVQPDGHKPSISDMEIHHHGHVHEKKKWKEYLFQFFMLFLAVFCGFLAEYQLEHVVEHNREEQYIKSFIEDLKADTAKINMVLEIKEKQHKGFDSLMGVIKKPDFMDNPAKIEKYVGHIFNLRLFNQTSRTIQQLKNAGGLRLIRKQAASDSIMKYDDMVKRVSEQEHDIYNANLQAVNLAMEIFDANSLGDGFINRNLVPAPGKARLITKDPGKIDEFFNRVINFKAASYFYSYMLVDLKESAVRQITFLKKQYDLE